MKKYRQLVCIPVLAILCIIYANMVGAEDMSYIYLGVPFGGDGRIVIINICFLACYVFAVFSNADEYISQYGCFLVVRNGSRVKVYNKIIVNVLFKTFIMELLKIIFFVLAVRLSEQRIQADAVIFIRNMTLYMLNIIILLMIQTTAELYLSAPTAALIVLVIYILSIAAGNIVYSQMIETHTITCMRLNLLIIFNYGMSARMTSIDEVLHINYIAIYGILSAAMGLIYAATIHKFKKKDIL